MRNITLSVSDETYHYARVWAAQRDTTITGAVRSFLDHLPILSGEKMGIRRHAPSPANPRAKVQTNSAKQRPNAG